MHKATFSGIAILSVVMSSLVFASQELELCANEVEGLISSSKFAEMSKRSTLANTISPSKSTGNSSVSSSKTPLAILVEAKAGYFYPTNSRFRKIYHQGGGIYGFEVSCQAWKGLYGWASGNYFTQSGHSFGQRSHTDITLVPLAAGLKYLFTINAILDLYIGAGILTTYLHMHDHSHFVIQSVSKWGVGGIWKAGAILNVYKRLFIDIFADYSYMHIPFHNTHHGKLVRHDVHASGVSAGGGIGYRF